MGPLIVAPIHAFIEILLEHFREKLTPSDDSGDLFARLKIFQSVRPISTCLAASRSLLRRSRISERSFSASLFLLMPDSLSADITDRIYFIGSLQKGATGTRFWGGAMAMHFLYRLCTRLFVIIGD